MEHSWKNYRSILRAAYSTNAQVDELVQSGSSSSSSSSADQGTVNSVEFLQFDHPDIVAKMTGQHVHVPRGLLAGFSSVTCKFPASTHYLVGEPHRIRILI